MTKPKPNPRCGSCDERVVLDYSTGIWRHAESNAVTESCPWARPWAPPEPRRST